jgi:hypothetical protein
MTFLSKLIIHFTYNSILSNWNYNFPIQKKIKKKTSVCPMVVFAVKEGVILRFSHSWQ